MGLSMNAKLDESIVDGGSGGKSFGGNLGD